MTLRHSLRRVLAGRIPATWIPAGRIASLLWLTAVAAACAPEGPEPAPSSRGEPRTAGEQPFPASNPAVLIEGGTFYRGTDMATPDVDPASPFSTHDEYPAWRTSVPGFWIQRHEVTNAEFARFDPHHTFPPGQERHPAGNVTFRAALAYAQSLGGSLPTETQWEFAARGQSSRIYPWGDEEPTCEVAHFRECEPRGTREVMSLPAGATPQGVYDLAGNVWEWVQPDWFRPGRTPINNDSRRMRGGSFVDDAFFLRASNRNNDFFRDYARPSVGFRVAWPLEDDG